MEKDRCAVIATHHKTGTVWMRSIFQAIAKHLDISFVSMKTRKLRAKAKLITPAVYFNGHSNFIEAPWMLTRAECRILHVIRDPRDVLISAMHYHRAAKERWLHKPHAIFDGMTYQQKLNSLPDDHARYLFEMQQSTMRIISGMRNWNYDMPSCFECKYEDLVDDADMTIFSKALLHLGFENTELGSCREEIWKHSLFGKKTGNTSHIRSGESRQWPKVFDKNLASAFVETFGNVLVELGYEADNSWVLGSWS